MSAIPAPVRPIQLSEIQEARKRIAKTIIRTPLVRLELGPEFPDIRLKLENLQPINAYKLIGCRFSSLRRMSGNSGHPSQAGKPATNQRLQVARRSQCRGDVISS